MESSGANAREDKADPLVGIILTALAALLIVGVLTFAGPCAVHDGGEVGGCFWAARAILGVAVVMLILSIVRIFERDEGERRGLSFAVACLGVLVALMPGVLIDLCAIPTMRCHTFMQPYCIDAGTLAALVGGVDLTLRLLRLTKKA